MPETGNCVVTSRMLIEPICTYARLAIFQTKYIRAISISCAFKNVIFFFYFSQRIFWVDICLAIPSQLK